MRRVGLAAALVASASLSVFLLLSLPSPARAEVFHDGQVLEPGAFSLGFEGEVQFDPGTNYLTFAHFGVGLPKNLDLGVKVSFFDSRTYFGADVQYGLLPDGEGFPALSAYAGGHWVDLNEKKQQPDFFGLDAGVTVSETIQEQSFFLGYDLDVDFPPQADRAIFSQRVFAGAKIVVSEHLSFFVEGGYGIKNKNEPTRNYVSGGPTLYF